MTCPLSIEWRGGLDWQHSKTIAHAREVDRLDDSLELSNVSSDVSRRSSVSGARAREKRGIYFVGTGVSWSESVARNQESVANSPPVLDP